MENEEVNFSWTVVELKAECKRRRMVGYSRLLKAGLIRALNGDGGESEAGAGAGAGRERSDERGAPAWGFSSTAPADRSKSPPRRPRSFGTPIDPNRATDGRNGTAFSSARKGAAGNGRSPARDKGEASSPRQDVMDKKETADQAYTRQSYELAHELYSEAIGMAVREDADIKARLFANRAAALMNLGENTKAIRDCEEALRLKPNYPKVVLRKASLHARLEEWELAIEDFEYCVDDANACPKVRREASVELEECRKRQLEEERRQKAREEHRREKERRRRRREAEQRAHKAEQERKRREEALKQQRRRVAEETRRKAAERERKAEKARRRQQEQERRRQVEEQRRRKEAQQREWRRWAEEQRRLVRVWRRLAEEIRRKAAEFAYEAEKARRREREQERRRQRAYFDQDRRRAEGGSGGSQRRGDEEGAGEVRDARRETDDYYDEGHEQSRAGHGHATWDRCWESGAYTAAESEEDPEEEPEDEREAEDENDDNEDDDDEDDDDNEDEDDDNENEEGWSSASGSGTPGRESSSSSSRSPSEPATPTVFSSGHYATLGITSAATTAEVKKAYFKLALQHHPDKNNGSAASTERFKIILAAYEVLCDESERAEYDASLSRS
eukprot:g11841.t1